jgi:hypothetical protein
VASAESEPQNDPVSFVDIAPLPKRKGEQRRTMGKESEILGNYLFKKQMLPRVKEKQRNTGNLTSRVTHTEKSTLQNPSKPSIQ